LQLIPIPIDRDALTHWAPHWAPFLVSVAKRERRPIEWLAEEIMRGETRLALAWDGEKAHALAGIQLVQRGDGLVGHIVFCTGQARHDWFDLLDEIERCLKEAGCVGVKTSNRLGWKRALKAKGYRVTHLVMEKAF
jgi:hypothetical protein